MTRCCRNLRGLSRAVLLAAWLSILLAWLASAFWSVSWRGNGRLLRIDQGNVFVVVQTSVLIFGGGWELQRSPFATTPARSSHVEED